LKLQRAPQDFDENGRDCRRRRLPVAPVGMQVIDDVLRECVDATAQMNIAGEAKFDALIIGGRERQLRGDKAWGIRITVSVINVIPGTSPGRPGPIKT